MYGLSIAILLLLTVLATAPLSVVWESAAALVVGILAGGWTTARGLRARSRLPPADA